MNKKYEAPQLKVQYFDVADRLTSDIEDVYSQIFDADTEIGDW